MTVSTEHDDLIELLLAPWEGPCGGVPPFDRATPAAIGRAYEIAVERKRVEVEAIADNPEPPTFDNTIAALEDAGRELQRLHAIYDLFARTLNDGEMGAVERRVAPLAPALEDEIVQNRFLWKRIRTVWELRKAANLSGDDLRLTEVVRERFLRRGADLEPTDGRRLAEINARIAELSTVFSQNTSADEENDVVWIEDEEGDLAGMGDELRDTLAEVARDNGLEQGWAVANRRTLVMAVLSSAECRDLRERVWRMWTTRGMHSGPHDNRPVIFEILNLRGEKAKLLDYPSYAHFATADRMCGDPETAMALVRRVWSGAEMRTKAGLRDIEALAAEHGVNVLEPWDRRFFAAKLRCRRFALDGGTVSAHLSLDNVLRAMFWVAGQLYGLEFSEDSGAPRTRDDVRVFAVRRGGDPAGMLWLDLFARAGKASGGWMWLIRSPESFRGRRPALTSINMNLAAPPRGQQSLLSWEDARVVFHEFGHALHALLGDVRYPSLGGFSLNPDFVELPSILNERWLATSDVLQRFALHHRTGEPMPDELIDALEAARQSEPGEGETWTLEYLATAVVDLELHLAADGRSFDPVEMEESVLSELGLPHAMEPLHRMAHFRHAFAGLFDDRYACGYFGYLWAETLAADVADVFKSSPGGLFDRETAERYLEAILAVGHAVPAREAFRNFCGRDPDPAALMRHLGIEGDSDSDVQG